MGCPLILLKNLTLQNCGMKWLGRGRRGLTLKVEIIKNMIMTCAFWNIRGLNKADRINCLADFIKTNKLDFIGIHKKTDLHRWFFKNCM
jgi:hypothetical protein